MPEPVFSFASFRLDPANACLWRGWLKHMGQLGRREKV